VNATLFGELGTFAVLVFFVNRFLWGPVTAMLEERRKRIADGLAAAERGHHEHQLAERRATELIHEAREQAKEIIDQAQKRAAEVVEESKADARVEGERILAATRAEVEQQTNQAREQLRHEVAGLAISGAEQILMREVDAEAHRAVLDKLAAQL